MKLLIKIKISVNILSLILVCLGVLVVVCQYGGMEMRTSASTVNHSLAGPRDLYIDEPIYSERLAVPFI